MKFGFRVWVFCFMPDHLHILLEGEHSDSDLKKFVSAYKQQTGYYYSKYVAESSAQPNGNRSPGRSPVAQGFSPARKLWQPSYYDHMLRRDEDTLAIARYILENPVRKELARDFLEYPFSGSFEIDISRGF